VAAAEAVGDRLDGVRLDVPSSRRGDLLGIVREVRWELDARGYSDVRVMVTGDLDEDTVRSLARHVGAFGVTDAVLLERSINLSFDIVEVDGRPRARRGSLSGRKALWSCRSCANRGIAPGDAPLEPCPRCGGRLRGLLGLAVREGRLERRSEDAASVRARALGEAEAAVQA
jgi:nicotinate phosphoribosyltransferase